MVHVVYQGIDGGLDREKIESGDSSVHFKALRRYTPYTLPKRSTTWQPDSLFPRFEVPKCRCVEINKELVINPLDAGLAPTSFEAHLQFFRL